MFSIVYQGISTRIAPLLKIDYTSEEMKSQIYISVVNWLLLISVLFVMYEFKESHKLAAAYGLTVTGSMVITGIMMTLIRITSYNVCYTKLLRSVLRHVRCRTDLVRPKHSPVVVDRDNWSGP